MTHLKNFVLLLSAIVFLAACETFGYVYLPPGVETYDSYENLNHNPRVFRLYDNQYQVYVFLTSASDDAVKTMQYEVACDEFKVFADGQLINGNKFCNKLSTQPSIVIKFSEHLPERLLVHVPTVIPDERKLPRVVEFTRKWDRVGYWSITR